MNSKTDRHHPGFGCCIYCYDRLRLRGEEHVIPLALQGNFIIDDASCRLCEKKINQFEGKVARSIFGNFRVKHGFRTRRPKLRPKHAEISIMYEKQATSTFRVPIAEHPTPLVVYDYEVPGILLGLPSNIDTNAWKPVVLADDKELKAVNKRYDGKYSFTFQLQPLEFAQQLAKIAYGLSISELGLFAFEPIIIDLLMGKFTNFGWLVGGISDKRFGPFNSDWSFRILYYIQSPFSFVICEINMFPSLWIPPYQVVVGLLKTGEQIRLLDQNVANARAIKLPFVKSKFIPRW